MPLALKDYINHEFIVNLEKLFSLKSKDFFITKKYNEFFNLKLPHWKNLELKERILVIAQSFSHAFPSLKYEQILVELKKVAPEITGLPAFVFPTYVEHFGPNHLEHWEDSMKALELFTVYSTGEFAVRAFFLKDPKRLMKQMKIWSSSPNLHLRRLASEGLRPRLPWGNALKELKKDPTPNLAILEQLKEDQELYVKKSVANHLNDIGKDHPELLLSIAKKWWGKNADTNWIVKHSLRSLLKKGDKKALQILGFQTDAKAQSQIKICAFELHQKSIKLGKDLSYQIIMKGNSSKIRVDVGLYYKRKKGDYGKKVFKIFDRELEGDLTILRKVSFRPMTTRKHLPGRHYLSIIINGDEKEKCSFEVKK